MKFSRSALKTRHVQLAHMTMMKPTQFSEDTVPSAPPRIYSTEDYASKRTNNGVNVPQELRNRIEASSLRKHEEHREDEHGDPPVFSRWGFF